MAQLTHRRFHPRPGSALPVTLAVAAATLFLARSGPAPTAGLAGGSAAPGGPKAIDVMPGGEGSVAAVCVRVGQTVRPGQVVAMVAVTPGGPEPGGALAELRRAARREEVRRVQEQVEAAQRRLQQARAERDRVLAGERPEEIRRLRALCRQTEVALALLREGTRPEVVARQRTDFRFAAARLSLLREGPRPEQVRQAEAALEQVQARRDLLKAGARAEELERLRAGLKEARVTLDNAESELRRAQALLTRGLVAGQLVEQTRTRRDVARIQLQTAQQRLTEGEAGARPEELRGLEAELDAARARLAELKAGARPQEIEQAEQQVERERQVLAQSAAAPLPQDVAQAEAGVDAARAQLAGAEAGARPEARRAAQAAVEMAEGEVRAARAALALAQTTARAETLAARGGRRVTLPVLAPAGGRVVCCLVRAGDPVRPGTALVRLLPGE